MINQEPLQRQNKTKIKALITGIVTIFILCFLGWEHLNGGVASHHILQQKSLPAISNWWSGLLLPVFTWFLLSRTEKRLDKQALQVKHTHNLQDQVLKLFIAGLVLGALIATSFTNGYSVILDNVPYIILMLSFIIPIYYAEFILGFILAMTFTFGAILPTVFILLLAAIGMLTYKFIRPLIIMLTMKLINKLYKSPNH